MKKKAFLTAACVALVAAISVMGTLAYLTDTDAAVNTFTIGNVDIILDEAAVDEDGKLILDAEGKPKDRVKENTYHLIPGQTYIKDPTITVVADSEEAYVRMMMTVSHLAELDAIFEPDGADLTAVFGGYDSETWKYIGETRDEEANSITYEFRYKETVTGGEEDVVLEALFTTFTLPGEMNSEELAAIHDLTITLEGHAIQAAGFVADEEHAITAEDAAWAAFDKQYEK